MDIDGIIFVDRYGGRIPSSLRSCFGQCEAMGHVPIDQDERGEPWRSLWLEAERKGHADDGWHFVICPDCKGTGRVPWWRSILRIPRWIWKGFNFLLYHPPRNPDMTHWQHVKLLLMCCWGYDILRLRN